MELISSAHLRLFRSLFCGRSDVFARHWINTRKETAGYAPAKFHTGAYAPLTDEIVLSHLRGQALIGMYPLQTDNSTRVLAIDFDGDRWLAEAQKLLLVARTMTLSCALERSKSGNGAHVWFFFETNIPAWKARSMGKYLLLESDITDRSVFDRLFPSQDEHSGKGLGNLIALPLHGIHAKAGNTCFLEADGSIASDQWAYLETRERIPVSMVDAVISNLPQRESDAGDETMELLLDRVRTTDTPIAHLVIGSEIFIPHHTLPDKLYRFLRSKLVFRNPEYLVKIRKGFSTWNTPEWIYVIRRYEDGIVVPGGLIGDIEEFAKRNDIALQIDDQQRICKGIRIPHSLVLRPEQEHILDKIMRRNRCVLEAPPGFGKTVIGLRYILKRKQPALIVVHTNELLRQWKKCIERYCTLKKGELGTIGASKWKPGSKITIASYMTLARRGVDDLRDAFGCVVIDECHHVPANTFTGVVRRLSAKYVLGLTATAYRKDKLERLMTLYIGPIVKAGSEPTFNISRSSVPVTVRVRHTPLPQRQDWIFINSETALLQIKNATH